MKRAMLVPMAIVLVCASSLTAAVPDRSAPAGAAVAAVRHAARQTSVIVPATRISPSYSEPASSGRLGCHSERLQQISDRWFVKLVRLQDAQIYDRIARQNGRLQLLERAAAALASIWRQQGR